MLQALGWIHMGWSHRWRMWGWTQVRWVVAGLCVWGWTWVRWVVAGPWEGLQEPGMQQLAWMMVLGWQVLHWVWVEDWVGLSLPEMGVVLWHCLGYLLGGWAVLLPWWVSLE